MPVFAVWNWMVLEYLRCSGRLLAEACISVVTCKNSFSLTDYVPSGRLPLTKFVNKRKDARNYTEADWD
jgi:hypothetical protein